MNSPSDTANRKQVDGTTCPCQSTFRRAEDVIAAVRSEVATETLIAWLKGDEVIVEVGKDFVVGREGKNKSIHADTYGRCPNRVGAAFAILNAVRDGCRKYLDKPSASLSSALPLAPSTASFASSPLVGSTSPVKPRYEDAFPSLQTSTSSATPNVLVPRKKKKQQAKKKQSDDPHRTNFPVPKAQTQQKVANAHNGPKVSGAAIKPGPKRRIRPVPATASSSSPWPSAPNTTKGGNIANLPSEDPSAMLKRQTQSGTNHGTGWPSANVGVVTSLPSEGPSAVLKQQPPTALKHGNGWPSVSTGVHVKGNIANLPSEDSSAMFKMKPPPGFGSGAVEPMKKKETNAMKPRRLDETLMNVQCGGKEVRNGDSQLATQQSELPESKPPYDKSTRGERDANESTCAIHDDSSLIRVVDIYATLIMHQLVPSIPLELHLLIRLLSMELETFSTSLEKQKGTDDVPALASVFSHARICRDFAARVLAKLEQILRHLGFEVTKKLILLPSMTELLPEVVSNLRTALDRDSEVCELDETEHGVGAMSITGNSKTPFLTVPFDHTRDSRHNFRSRDQTLLFNNREESRDAFMYQLRAFQEIRGTVLDPSQADMFISEIKVACRDMINTLHCGNMAWFAGLFSDLLLQIGLVAMEETDKDILRHVADKDRLKKLHRRFTSRGGQKNRSSQKLVLDQKSQASSSSSASQPEHYFSGHQEFFFIFLRAVDSYQFGVHLRRRLVGLIDGLNAIDDVKGLEQRVVKLQLLAKFLGLLVFSPNWNTISPDALGNSSVVEPTDSNECLAHLNCTDPIIHLRKYIEESWKHCRLVVTIPWVVEFLRMATWDSLSIQTTYYRDVFAMLRSIHRFLGQIKGNLYSSRQIVVFQLENLFADVIGLGASERLPAMILPDRSIESARAPVDVATARLDMLPLRFSKTYLFASSSHLEEFYKLVAELIQHNGKLTGKVGASKKLRPCAISVNVEASTTSAFAQEDSGQLSVLSSQGMPRGFKQKGSGIQGKLVDAFFHQHRDLQQICDFVIEISVKNVLAMLVRDCISPVLESPQPIDEPKSRLDALQGKEQEASTAAREMLRQKCETCIQESMKALAPPLTKPDVFDMAVTLSVRHACQKGENLIQSIVWEEVEKKRGLWTKAEAKKSTAPSTCTRTQAPAVCDGEAQVQNNVASRDLKLATSALHQVMNAQGDQFWNRSEHHGCAMQAARASLLGVLRKERLESIDGIQPEAEANEFVTELMAALELWFSAPNARDQYWPSLFAESVGVAIVLGKIGVSNVGPVGSVVSANLPILIAWDQNSARRSNESDANTGMKAADLLVDMLRGKLVSLRVLEYSLISVLDDEAAQGVARLCIEEVTGGDCMKNGDWVNGNALKMSRLQARLARQQRQRL